MQLALHRPRVLLDLPAAVAGAGVFDRQPEAGHGVRRRVYAVFAGLRAAAAPAEQTMFLKRFFEPKLAQTSYLIGCAVAREGHRHRPESRRRAVHQGGGGRGRAHHARHRDAHPRRLLSGSRELAARTGATLYLSDEGDAAWKYQFAGEPGVDAHQGRRSHHGRQRAHRRGAHAGPHAGAPRRFS